jgi:hypothetical protein
MMSALSAIAPYASLKPARSLGHFAASLARTAISMVGSITFLASLALALAIVTDVPGMFASGIVKHPSPFEFEQALGTPQWPRLLVDLGAAACIVTAMISLTMLLFVRRGGGGLHILRGLFGALTLFSAVFALGQALPGWADIAPGPTPADTLDAYLRHAQLSHVLWAAGVFLIGMVVLFWPASRRVRMIGTPKTPTLPHAPGGATAATGTAGQKVG